MEVVFGIYLGNSTCSVAVNKENNVDVVANAGGDRVTPAVVSVHDDEVVTGLAAKQGLLKYGARSVMGVLRHISSTASESASTASGSTCPPTFSDDGDVSYSIQMESSTKTVKAVDVLKYMFLQLKDISTQHNNSSECTACLCLPAWVSDRAVALTREAAREAGFRIVTVILQPTAACLAYNLLQDKTQPLMLVLSLHLGESGGVGGVLEVSGGMVTVRDTTTTATAPGVTLTNKLVEYLAKEFYMKYHGDCLENKRSRQKLYNQAENVKHVLSTRPTSQVNVDSLWEGVDFSCQVSRARFEGLIKSTLSDFLAPTLQMLERLNIEPNQIDKVLLSGGTCKIPRLQHLIGETFPTAEVHSSIPPDEVLAYGAAIEARAVTSKYGVAAESVAVVNGVAENAATDDAPKEGKSKKKRAHTERRKQEVLRSHLPVLVSALSVPVWCKVPGNKSVCALGRLSPPLLKNTFSVPITGITENTVLTLALYESQQPLDDEDATVPSDALLAQIKVSVSSETKELNMSCLLKPDGSLQLSVFEPVSKSMRKFVVSAEEDGDSS
uniref:Heat shock 70 kDa protein 14-like n=1 Tax=Hirondellea gigas TaxID=1518452 RepID=A0A2P2I1X1_9CRUS